MILLWAFGFFLFCGGELQASDCPDDWLAHGSSCYHFSNERDTWDNAVKKCQILDGFLVEIENATENQFLVTQAKHLHQSFWIGLNDQQKEGTWVWVNSGQPGSYTNWYKGQPDNGSNNENCVEIQLIYNFVWNDQQCFTHLHYICERTTGEGEVLG